MPDLNTITSNFAPAAVVPTSIPGVDIFQTIIQTKEGLGQYAVALVKGVKYFKLLQTVTPEFRESVDFAMQIWNHDGFPALSALLPAASIPTLLKTLAIKETSLNRSSAESGTVGYFGITNTAGAEISKRKRRTQRRPPNVKLSDWIRYRRQSLGTGEDYNPEFDAANALTYLDMLAVPLYQHLAGIKKMEGAAYIQRSLSSLGITNKPTVTYALLLYAYTNGPSVFTSAMRKYNDLSTGLPNPKVAFDKGLDYNKSILTAVSHYNTSLISQVEDATKNLRP